MHVMCEKPLSRSWLEAAALIQTIERTGKFYQHNENWLFDPDYYTVKKLVDSGAIGELAMMFLTQAHGGPEGNPRFWNPDFGGGGALLDNGIHAIGAAWFIAGLHKTPTLRQSRRAVRHVHPNAGPHHRRQVSADHRRRRRAYSDPLRGQGHRRLGTAHVEGSWSEQDSPDTVYIGTTGSIKMVQEDGKRFAVVCDIKGNGDAPVPRGRLELAALAVLVLWRNPEHGAVRAQQPAVHHDRAVRRGLLRHRRRVLSFREERQARRLARRVQAVSPTTSPPAIPTTRPARTTPCVDALLSAVRDKTGR